MAAGQAAEWGLSWYFQWGRQISIPTWIDTKFGSSSRSTKIIKDIRLLDDHENHLNQHEYNQKLCNGKDHPPPSPFEFEWKLIENKGFQILGAEQILVLEIILMWECGNPKQGFG